MKKQYLSHQGMPSRCRCRCRCLSVFIFLLIIFFLSSPILAAEFFVPDDYLTIQEAMETAEYGDTIRVRSGIYYERVIIKEGISLISDQGPDGEKWVPGPGEKQVLKRAQDTIIDGSKLIPADYLVSFQKECSGPMKLDGFTIRHLPQQAIDKLFLIEARGCSPVIINNIVHGNHSKGKGGGILLTGLGPSMGPPLETVAKPIVQDNIIYDNFGPGIANGSNSISLIKANEIFNNHFFQAKDIEHDAPGIGLREYARPQIINNLCYLNGSGIGGLDLVNHDQPIIIKDNIIRNNHRAGLGLRALNKEQNNITVILEGNTIYGNLKAGVWLANIPKATIQANEIYTNLSSGIALYGAKEVFITQNIIHSNLTAGVIIDSQEALIKKNQIFSNVNSGLTILPPLVELEDEI